MTLIEILADVVRHPWDVLVRRWNWKSALTSAMMRGGIFFAAVVPAGRGAALSATLVEMLFRATSCGVLGSVTQQLRLAEPAWSGALAAIVVLPAVSQGGEFLVHWLRGTPRLAASSLASIIFTVVSTLFNLYIQRNGVLIVGEAGGRSLGEDLKAIPRMIAGFVSLPFRAAWKAWKRRVSRV
jgi:hypothetical protein